MQKTNLQNLDTYQLCRPSIKDAVIVETWRGMIKLVAVFANERDQPGVFGTTFSVTVEGPDNWKVVRKTDGKILLTANWRLSHDGNTLDDDFTLIQPNRSKFNVYYVYKRTAGGPGFDRTWESTSEKVNSVFELQIQPYEGDGLAFIIPSEGIVKNLNFDGKDYAYERPNVKAKFASSIRRVDALTLEVTDKVDGKLAGTEEAKFAFFGVNSRY
jgi:hypothetical protein